MKVFITVDVEPSVAGYFSNPLYKPLIEEPVWGEYNGYGHALPFIVDTLSHSGLKGTFFVETISATVFGDKMAEYARYIHESGQDVQLHLHPCWDYFENGALNGAGDAEDNCGKHDQSYLLEKIQQGIAYLEGATGSSISAMRTGNFASSIGVYRAMSDAGIISSSNLCRVGMQNDADFDQLTRQSASDILGILEIPVTCFTDIGIVGRGNARPLQITACSFNEMKNILLKEYQRGTNSVVIVTHPFEFIKYKDFRFKGLKPNYMVQNRFTKLCNFLAQESSKFEVSTFGEINREGKYSNPSPESMVEGNSFMALSRAIFNFLNDRL